MCTKYKIGNEVQRVSDTSKIGTVVELCEIHEGVQLHGEPSSSRPTHTLMLLLEFEARSARALDRFRDHVLDGVAIGVHVEHTAQRIELLAEPGTEHCEGRLLERLLQRRVPRTVTTSIESGR